MPHNIDINTDIRTKRWSEGDVRMIKRAIRTAITNHGEKASRDVSVSLVLTADEHVREINLQWRKMNKPTNVLSFPSGELEDINQWPAEIPLPLGDIVIAYETSANEAKAAGMKMSHYASYLAVHGALHLLGYDHETDDDHAKMTRAEQAVLLQLGIAYPADLM